MASLFKKQEEFSDECAYTAQTPGERDKRVDQIAELTARLSAERELSKKADDRQQFAMQGCAEREQQARELGVEMDARALSAMREIILQPASDATSFAEVLDRFRREIHIRRSAVAWARQFEIPGLLVERLEADAKAAATLADIDYLSALVAGATSMQASEELAELEGLAVFMPDGSRTAQLFEQSRRSYLAALASEDAANNARNRAELLAKGATE